MIISKNSHDRNSATTPAFALKGLSKKKKVKRTLVQALRLCTGHTAHRGSRGIAVPSVMTTVLEGGEGSA